MTGSDVIVVGAGITGASTAYHLARQGVSVTLVERGHPACGPTGRSSALIHAFYLLPELSQLARRGMDMFRNLPELTRGGTADYQEIGMAWGVGPDDASEWTDAVERIQGEGADIEAISPQQLAALAPGFEVDGIALGVWEPPGGYADPASSTQAFVDDARGHGARVLMGAEVRRLLVDAGRITGVEVDGDRIESDAVVVAAGPWTRMLIGQVGVDLPLFVERHAIAVVDAPSGARDVLPFAWCDDTTSHYARPESDNLIFVGAWAGGGTSHRSEEAGRPDEVSDPDRYDEHAGDDESAWIVGHMMGRVPAVSKLGLRRGYAGLYDMSPDDLPIIDGIPGADGLFVAAGTSGHGFKLGPAVGEEVARLVTTGSSELLAPFGVDRDFAAV